MASRTSAKPDAPTTAKHASNGGNGDARRSAQGQMTADMASDAFLSELLATAKRFNATADPAAPVAEQIRLLEKEKARAAELALSTDD